MATDEEFYLLSETEINASKNYLTQYLYKIYNEEIQFKICDEELSRIEKEVTNTVQIIAKYAKTQCKHNVKARLNYICSMFSNMKMIKDCKGDLIKVGSFYERTKNRFPDEFDYLFPIFTFETDLQYYDTQYLRYELKCFESFHDVISKLFLSNEDQMELFRHNERIFFKSFAERRGPSSKLELSYKTNINDTIEIPVYVDLVPCFKITFSQSTKYKSDFIRRSLLCEEFERHVTLTNSFVLVDHRNPVSFTETEVRFMKEELSDKHRKVYRILKFLLNGHVDNEALRTAFKQKGLCSYYIKCAIIYHHFRCDNENDHGEEPCVLATLRYLKCDLEKNLNYVTLLTSVAYVGSGTTKALKKLLRHLEEMQKPDKVKKQIVESAAKTQFDNNVKEMRIDDCKECCMLPAEIYCAVCSDPYGACCVCREICYENLNVLCVSGLTCVCIFTGVITIAGIIYFLVKFLGIFA